jgi:hypothetical protein
MRPLCRLSWWPTLQGLENMQRLCGIAWQRWCRCSSVCCPGRYRCIWWGWLWTDSGLTKLSHVYANTPTGACLMLEPALAHQLLPWW